MKKGKTEGNTSGRDAKNENWFFKQSSELELLISAAIVFASFAVSDLVETMIFTFLNNNVPSNSEWLFLLAIVSLFTSSILPLTIVVHFIFRFYWLSLVGLRTVFNGKLEIQEFSEKFRGALKKPLDLDKQIDIVDRISSSIFAFAFMTMFAFILSTTSVFIIYQVILPSIYQLFDNNMVLGIVRVLQNLFLLICFIYMIDFFTLGWFKRIKKKWFIRIYYPLYRVMSAITFSFFYRGIYYSLVQQTSRKFMAFLLPIYVFLAIFKLNAGYSPNKIYDSLIYSYNVGDASFKNPYYADRFEKNLNVQVPFLESYILLPGQNHINLHIPIMAFLEDSLLARCDIQPVNEERSINWRKYIQTDFNRPKFDKDFSLRENAESTIDCFKRYSRVLLDDTVEIDPKYRFMEWQYPEKNVFMTTISTLNMNHGEHYVTFKYVTENKDRATYRIPFWID